jgi:hypothetical protein
MEAAFNAYLTTEEKILAKMKEFECSTYWLSRKTGRSQSYCYSVLCGKGERKVELTPEFLDLVNAAFPGCNFTPNPLPHEQAAQSLTEKPLFKDENNS